MSNPITVLLVDDHALMRDMLANRLSDEPDLQVVGTVESADAALTAGTTHEPDIILMDIDMPGLSCFDAARTLQRLLPKTSIIFLSAFFNDRYIEQALAIEASGFLTKTEPPESVIAAVRAVAAGKCYFSAEAQSRIVIDSGRTRLAHPVQSRASTLTNRELEVLRYLARGMAKKEIARTMHVSAKTVNNHASHLMNKLDIHDRVELSRFAIREGLAEA